MMIIYFIHHRHYLVVVCLIICVWSVSLYCVLLSRPPSGRPGGDYPAGVDGVLCYREWPLGGATEAVEAPPVGETDGG